MNIEEHLLEILKDKKNEGFKALLGLQMVNAGQSHCYIMQMANIVAKCCSLPVHKVEQAIKHNAELYKILASLKMEVANALVNIKKSEGGLHDVLQLLMGRETSIRREKISEEGYKEVEHTKYKINPQIAREFLRHDILEVDTTVSDLSNEEIIPILKEEKKEIVLIPKTERKRIESKLDSQQRKALDVLLDHDHPNKILSLGGAVRCGKTYIAAYASLRYIEFHYENSVDDLNKRFGGDNVERSKGNIIFIGRSAPAVFQNLFSGVLNFFKLNAKLPAARSFLWKVLNYDIRLIGYGKLSLESLKGITADHIHVDECENMALDSYDMIITRLSNPWSKLFLVHNPKTPAHWLWQKIKTKELQDKNMITHFNFSLKDCEFVDKNYVAMLEANHGKGSAIYKRYCLGIPAAVSGVVFSQFNEERNIIPVQDNLTKYESFYIGNDHGHNSPRVYTVVGIYRESGEWMADVIDELYYPKGHGDIKTMIDYLNELKNFYTPYADRVKAIYLPHDAGDQKKILSPIYPIKNASRKLKVLDGIGLLNSMFSTGRLKIAANCKNLISELFTYSYDSEKDFDQPIKCDDHCCDSLRYALTSCGFFQMEYSSKEEDLMKSI